MKNLLFSLFLLISLSACISEENVEEPSVLDESLEANEFTREEMVETQIPRLKKRSTREKLNRPLAAPFFEESFMLVNIAPTEQKTNQLPLLFALTEGKVEITQILPIERESAIEIEGTSIAQNSNYKVKSTSLRVINQEYSGNVLAITIETKDLEEVSFEFVQISNGIFTDKAGNEYRALSGVLEIAI